MEPPRLTRTAMNEAFVSNQLFVGLSVEVLRGIHIREIEYGPGEMIFDEDALGATILLVGTGSVQISKLGRRGLQENLATIEAGNFFGELAVIDHGPRSARAIALEHTLLGEIDRSTFNKLLQCAPDTLLWTFARTVVQRLRYTNSYFIEQLLQAERMSLLGTMVSSIIHDFKNPLSAILSSADYLERKATNSSVLELADIIRSAVVRMVQMSEELLDFARGTKNLRLGETSIREILKLLEDEILTRVRATPIRVVVQADKMQSLFLDEVRLTRCLANIVKNAQEALGDEGTITIIFRDLDPNMQISVSD
ncbi:MAG: cyclic nucleotide-binding domain-containing protein, partial [Verrucomicrobia bacterium]|nr:cyclic nucleotide-binding domain-containing protein [Verrucomicrobiota bacterium]